MTSNTAAEISSQPGLWDQCRNAAIWPEDAFPSKGERVAFVGCGTSWYIADSLARLREERGHGLSDAFAASEMPHLRPYDRVVALSRSGTTTEIIELLEIVTAPSVLVTASPDTPAVKRATRTVTLDFADEHSVVQTRFPTCVFALFRSRLGEDISELIEQASTALLEDQSALLEYEHFVFLGRGWSVGIAREAALKLVETAAARAEAHPAMEYRHGPISVARPRSLVWAMSGEARALERDVRATGAQFIGGSIDPLAELVRVQRLAVALAEAKFLDPDEPTHLTRSVILEH